MHVPFTGQLQVPYSGHATKWYQHGQYMVNTVFNNLYICIIELGIHCSLGILLCGIFV